MFLLRFGWIRWNRWLVFKQGNTILTSRRLNVVAVCYLLPQFDKELLFGQFNNIMHVCLVTVHNEMMKKIALSQIVLVEEPLVNSQVLNTKNLNIRMSSRKRYLIDNDPLIKQDLHQLFVDSVQVNLNINFTDDFD